MKARNGMLAWVLVAGFASASDDVPALPEAVSNNAAAIVASGSGHALVTATGLGAGKSWQDTVNDSWFLILGESAWQPLDAVPGDAGRLAAVAVGVGDAVWLFGGYTVAADGSEVSTPEVFRWRPGETGWVQVSEMPVPVDDMVALVYRQRWVYLVSGWHDVGNVNLVQVLDTETGEWSQAEPWPGPPVFGHAGAIVEAMMVICDGVRIAYPADGGARQFVPSDECWRGTVREEDPRRIDWQPLPAHPGMPRYRMAAGSDGRRIYFLGGSTNPYNYDGIGYNGQPSTPLASVFGMDPKTLQWECFAEAPVASMDHRGLPFDGERFYLVGGMRANQQVSAQVMPWQPSAPVPCPG